MDESGVRGRTIAGKAVRVNYYERHLGDYAKNAGHLTMLQHGAYTLLLDRYYSTERAIPDADAYEICRARRKKEREAVDTVLRQFFRLIDGYWTKNRCEEELGKARVKIETARNNGRNGGRPRRADNETEVKPTGFDKETHRVIDKKPTGFENETQTKALQSPVSSLQSPSIPPTPLGKGGDVADAQSEPRARRERRASNGYAPYAEQAPIVTHEQRERKDLHELMARREAIGIGGFRDPNPGESSSQYRSAQDAEWTRRRDARSGNERKASAGAVS